MANEMARSRSVALASGREELNRCLEEPRNLVSTAERLDSLAACVLA